MTQGVSPLTLAKAGIRYFDIRVLGTKTKDKYYSFHGKICGRSKQTIVSHLNEIKDQLGKHEIVILHFKQFSFTAQSSYNSFQDQIVESLGDKLIIRPSEIINPVTTTLEKLSEKGKFILATQSSLAKNSSWIYHWPTENYTPQYSIGGKLESSNKIKNVGEHMSFPSRNADYTLSNGTKLYKTVTNDIGPYGPIYTGIGFDQILQNPFGGSDNSTKYDESLVILDFSISDVLQHLLHLNPITLSSKGDDWNRLAKFLGSEHSRKDSKGFIVSMDGIEVDDNNSRAALASYLSMNFETSKLPAKQDFEFAQSGGNDDIFLNLYVNSSRPYKYDLYRWHSGQTSWTRIANDLTGNESGGNMLTYLDKNLTDGTTYYYYAVVRGGFRTNIISAVPHNLDEELSHWKFDGNGNDEKGYSHASIHGLTTFDSQEKVRGTSSVRLNGSKSTRPISSSWLSLSRTIVITGAFTFTGWVRLTPGIDYCDGMFQGLSDQLSFRSSKVTFGWRNNGNFDDFRTVTSTEKITANTWYHIAVTRDKNNLVTVYVNGTAQPDTKTLSFPLTIYVLGAVEMFGLTNGYMDDFRVYSRALTATEIKEIGPIDPPKSLRSRLPSPTSIELTWQAAGNCSIPCTSKYEIYRNGVKIGATKALEYTDSNLIPNKTYTYSISSVSTEGVYSAKREIKVTTKATRPIEGLHRIRMSGTFHYWFPDGFRETNGTAIKTELYLSYAPKRNLYNWYLTRNTDGSYYITSKGNTSQSSSYLASKNSTKARGQDIVINAKGSTAVADTRKWILEPTGSGVDNEYKIKMKGTSNYITTQNFSKGEAWLVTWDLNSGTNGDAQKWILEPVSLITDGSEFNVTMNNHPDKYWHMAGNNTTASSSMEIYNNNAYSWVFEKIGKSGNLYNIRLKGTGNYLEIVGNTQAPGARVDIYPLADANDFKWHLEPTGIADTYYVRSYGTNLYITTAGYSSSASAKLQLDGLDKTKDSFKWKLSVPKVTIPDKSEFNVTMNNHSDKYWHMAGHNTTYGDVEIYNNNAYSWVFEKIGKSGNLYNIRLKGTNNYLEIIGNTQKSGAMVDIYSLADANDYKWYLEPTGIADTYYVRSYGTNLYITTAGYSSSASAKLQIYGLDITKDSFKWKFSPSGSPASESAGAEESLPGFIENQKPKQPEEKTGIILYPNPSSDRVTLKWNNEAGANVSTLAVYNFSGQVVISRELKVAKGNNELVLNIRSLKQGLYQVKIEGQGFSKRLMVK